MSVKENFLINYTELTFWFQSFRFEFLKLGVETLSRALLVKDHTTGHYFCNGFSHTDWEIWASHPPLLGDTCSRRSL